MAPRDNYLTRAIVGWLTAMAGAKIVNAKNIPLLPTTVHHVLVNGTTNFVHLEKGNGGTITKGGGQGHFVTEETILDECEQSHQHKMDNEVEVFDAFEAVPKFHGESRPMKDLKETKLTTKS